MSANPYDAPDMVQTNPYDSPDMIEGGSPPVPQAGAISAGIKSALPGLQSQLGEGEGYAARLATKAGATGLADWLHQKSQENAAEVQAGQNPGNTLPADAGTAARAGYGIAQGVTQVGIVGGAGAATGAAIGAAIGAPVLGIGAVPGAIAGGVLGWTISNIAALPALMGFSQSGRTADKTYDYAKSQGASDEEANNQAIQAGALTGVAAGGQGVILGLLGPLGKVVGKAPVGSLVETTLAATAGDIAKSTAKAAGVGALSNAAATGATDLVEQKYAGGEGVSGQGLIDSAIVGAGQTALLHAPAEGVRASKMKRNAGILGDPTADANDRQKAAAAVVAALSTRDKQLAEDFGIYSAVQIARGLPVDVASDHVYQAFAQDAKDQAARYAAQQQSGTPTNGTFTPGQGDRTFGPAPTDNTNQLPPSKLAAQPKGTTAENATFGADTSMQGQDINRPMPSDPNGLRAAVAAEAPPVVETPLNPNDVPGSIESLNAANGADDAFLDRALSAAHQALRSTDAGALAEQLQNPDFTGVPTGPASERLGTPDQLAPEQQFYAEQRDQAAGDMRQQAFDQAQQLNAPPAAPADAFTQRNATLADEAQRLRDQGHLAGVYDQAMAAPERAAPAQAQADAVARAAGEGEAKPTAMSSQMTAALNQLAGRKPANLTTAQLDMLVTHHPDAAVQQAAQQVLNSRRNRALVEKTLPNAENVSEVAPTGEMTGMRGPGKEPQVEFSQQRAEIRPADRLAGVAEGQRSGEPVEARPAAPEVAPLKTALDAEARARGQDAAGDFEHVTRDALPDERTPANNGVQNAETMSKAEYDLMKKSADLNGQKLVVFRQHGTRPGEALDGATLDNDPHTIYVNADASGAHHLVVFGHELAHQMQTNAPDLWKTLSKSVMKQAKSGALADFAKYYGETGDIKDPAVRDRVMSEFVADLVGNRHGELNTWRQVFAGADKADRGLIYRIANFVTSFIDRLLANTKFRQFATDDMVKNLTDVRTSVRRALTDYANRQGMERMAHEAEQLRAAKANRDAQAEPAKRLVEPVKAEPRAPKPDMLTRSLHDRSAPAPVGERTAEPVQGTKRIEQSGTPRTERVQESAQRNEVANERTNAAPEAGRTEADAVQAARGNVGGGRVELTHYSSRPGISELDPSFHGTGLKGAELKRREHDPANYLNRTYYGMDIGKPGGYVKESALGNHEYKASVDASKLYDADADPEGLHNKGALSPYMNRASLYEKAIHDAGYQGYSTQHPSLGKVAVVFDKLPVEQRGVANEGRTETDAITKSVPAGTAAADAVSRSGVVRGSARWLAEQSRSHQGDDLAGIPSKVTIPGVGAVEFHSFKPAQESAAKYMRDSGRDYNPPKQYVKVDPERATRIAQEFDRMKHDPQNPEVRAAYDAMIRETEAQYQALLDTGLKVEFIKPGQEDPYAASPRLAHLDVLDNNHMWVFSTREGFGSSEFNPVDNPLLSESGHKISGETALANDLFRVVHDYYGHIANGVGFRADGEENAWRSHMAMYSDEARRAATTETRGQNSWVNYGPYGDSNRTAGGSETHFADQKIGLLPQWVVDEGRTDEPASTRLGKETAGDGTANPFSSNPEVRKSGERASYIGKLDAAQEAAVKNVSGALDPKKTIKQSFDDMRKDIGKKMQQGIADQFAPIRDLDQHAYMLSRLSKGSDGALEAALLYGAPVIRDGVYDVDVKGRGLAAIMGDLEGEHNRALLWEAAHRAEQLKAEGRENLFTDSDISALKTLDRPDAAHPNRAAKFAKWQKEYRAFNEAFLKIGRDSGILSDEDYKLFRDQPYVPFFRVMEDGPDGGMTGPGSKSSGLVNQYAFKRLKGGKAKLNDDLLVNVLSNYSHLLAASSRNRAAQATMDAAERLGVATKISAADAGKGTVRVKVGGKDVHYEVDDPHLLAAVSAMSMQVPKWMKPLSTFKHVLTHAVTVMPGFKLRNLIRDSVQALAVGDLSPNIIGNVAEGIKGTSKTSQTYASMLASGGIIRMGSLTDGNDASRVHRLIQAGVPAHTILNRPMTERLFDQARELYDAYQELGDRSENINRAALYQQLIKQGKSHAEASFMSRDMMDFSMQGNWPVIRFLTQSVPFMNARIQGLYKLGKAAVDNPGRVGAVVGATMMASVALAAMYKDDPDWKQREDWDRDNYWWFKIGGTAFRIPKPFEVGATGTIAERTWELMTDKEMTASRFGGQVADILGQQFSLNPTPQIVKPLMDVYANKDGFTGRPIENQAMQTLRPEDRYSQNTSMTARFLGQLGLPDPVQLIQGRYSALSPVQMESLLHGYFGSLGNLALGATDAILRPATGQASAPSTTPYQVTSGMVDTLSGPQSRYVTAMYDNLNNIEQAYNSYRMYLKTGQREQAQEELAAHRDLIRAYPMAEAAKRAMSQMSAQEKRILNDTNMSSAEKRQKLDALTSRKNALAQRIALRELDRQQQ
jgi:hypothetical protein